VCLSVANDHASLPIAYRLYQPGEWANDPDRRRTVGVADDVRFQTKPRIALGQIKSALRANVAPATMLMDAGYGTDTKLRDGITELGLYYVAGIQSSTSVWHRAQRPSHRGAGAATDARQS
jgi:SRSO17 transposase